MPYDQIVFAGYVIDTAPQLNSNGSETYLGLPDPEQDIAARCQLMQAAMQQARSMLPPPASPPVSTLIVFVAPEFFFRGQTGAYSMDDVQVAIAELQEIAADAQWDDWVFEFGTIVGNYEDPNSNPTTQICNFALVQQGGMAAQGPDGARAIVKELKSGIDFIAANANPGGLLLGAVTHPDADAPSPGAEQQQVAYDGAGIFQLAGVNWAVEICLDHLEGRLQNSPQLPGSPEVQVQLVPSCGADIEDAGVIAQPDGYVFNVDGFRGQAHANLSQSGPPLVTMPRSASAAVNVANVTLPSSPPSSPPITVPVSDLYASGAGSIWLYAPVPMPAVRTVPGSTDQYPPWLANTGPDWAFTFYLIYDDAGNFSSALCSIKSSDVNFQNNKYELPLSLTLTFPPTPSNPIQATGSIDIELRQGGDGYDHGIYGTIAVPGFNFQGEIMQFMTAKASPDPVQKIWPGDPTSL